MTREKIIQGLYRGDSRAIKEAIKTLEQEPCEDCVSREAVKEELRNRIGESISDCINALPSVTPARKKGKWIFSGSYDEVGMLYCSCCKHEIDVSEGCFKYCPNCGAKMDEDERKLKYADQDTMMLAT